MSSRSCTRRAAARTSSTSGRDARCSSALGAAAAGADDRRPRLLDRATCSRICAVALPTRAPDRRRPRGGGSAQGARARPDGAPAAGRRLRAAARRRERRRHRQREPARARSRRPQGAGGDARILRPGARAVIVVPAGPGTYDYYDRFLGHERRYARGELAGQGERRRPRRRRGRLPRRAPVSRPSGSSSSATGAATGTCRERRSRRRCARDIAEHEGLALGRMACRAGGAAARPRREAAVRDPRPDGARAARRSLSVQPGRARSGDASRRPGRGRR